MKKRVVVLCLCLVMIVTMIPFGAVYGMKGSFPEIPKAVQKVVTLEETLDYAMKNGGLIANSPWAIFGNSSPVELFGLQDIEAAGGRFETTGMSAGDIYFMRRGYEVHHDGAIDIVTGNVYQLNLFNDNSSTSKKTSARIKNAVLSKLNAGGKDEWTVAVNKYSDAFISANIEDPAREQSVYRTYVGLLKEAGYEKHINRIYYVQAENKKSKEQSQNFLVTAIDKPNVVESIKIKKAPTKKVYSQNDREINIDGGVIEATYTDGTKRSLKITPSMVAIYAYLDFSALSGDERLYVMYGGKLASYPITVKTNSEYIPVSTKEELNAIRDNLEGKYYLTRDIVFTNADFEPGGMFYNDGAGWIPIGKSWENPFFGELDGRGHKISGLVSNPVTNTDVCYGGLFGYIRKGVHDSKISNLTIEDCSITAKSKFSTVYAGAITGYAQGASVINCHVSGYVSAADYAGGICGEGSALNIENCSNSCTVQSKMHAGGIVGDISNNETKYQIANCYNIGNVTSRIAAGGIVGNMNGSELKQCYNAGNIKALCTEPTDIAFAGGIVGASYSGELRNCFNIGSIYTSGAHRIAGGIAGRNSSTIEKAYDIGYVTGDLAGSIYGENAGSVTECYYVGSQENSVSSGTDSSVKCTLDELKQQGSFAGFDFGSVWTMGSDENYPFPNLRNMPFSFKKALIGIKVGKLPTKTEYIYGDTNLDLSGGELTLIYNNGTEETVALTNSMFSGFDNTIYDAQTVNIEYKGFKTSFNVNFIPQPGRRIEIVSQPTGATHYGDDQPNLAGAQIKIYYEDGSNKIVNVTKDMIKGYDPYKVGVQSVNLWYGGVSLSITLNVEPAILSDKLVELQFDSHMYTGYEIMPGVYYKGLKRYVDYEVELRDNVNVGTATVVITGIGNYQGTIIKHFEITEPKVDFKAPGWQKVYDDTYYVKPGGTLARGWETIDGLWYYFNDACVMQTDWQKINGKWYYFHALGMMLTGWQQIGDAWYYFDASGAMVTGWMQEGSTWYYLTGSGAMATGWTKVGSAWYYFDEYGVMQTGWQQIGSTWYYFTGSGAMATGWAKVGGRYYYFAGSGAMKTGWMQEGRKWYYLTGSGAMATGWTKVGSTWYYMSSSGAMQTGWQKISNKWYYLTGSGAMATGWTKVGGTYYYFSGSGAMQTGWLKSGSTWYYLNSSGAMATGWLKLGGTWYYFTGSGAMVTGTQYIGGVRYTFSSSGAML